MKDRKIGEGVPFTHIARITGYLATTKRFNSAKLMSLMIGLNMIYQYLEENVNRPRVNHMINVAGIYHNDLANGPNLRTVLFVQGCPHHCKGCHNKHTWEFGAGDDLTSDHLVKLLTENPLDKGITISGGEPICQWENLYSVIQQLKDKKYHLMLYTGYTRTWLNNKIKTDDLFFRFFYHCSIWLLQDRIYNNKKLSMKNI